ncbi:flocculation-associated PEP-CTERM protein PepA [Massilia genomosp. 1]|uniref:Flocculation-associated PEP-CTERM protein PepA n=1 Tax=Massilia genomosp. 1 TaxID=2609280 RepID=A0ABX0MXJ9_9BURK|nr:flocculation-associated PEP-CTERM protein PepA [Massilia genomosp. 1]NHZ65425.1 flocculation-associated PEP-CTERM protein PepA [Massilia genomosp. 1]
MQTKMKRLRRLAVSTMLLIGALSTGEAGAVALFTVNPNFLTVGGTPFEATAISGLSSSRIAQVSGDKFTSDGYAVFTGFAKDNAPISGNITKVNGDYGLYARFHQDLSCKGGLARGVTCDTTAMTFSLYADIGNKNDYHMASLAAGASVDDYGAKDILLASSNVLHGGIGGLDQLGGAFQNMNIGWTLSDIGAQYFTSPTPFYNAAFTAFNNTSQGLSCDKPKVNCQGATVVAIASQVGVLDFNTRAVPEPGALALMGIGLLGLGTMRRRAGR